MKVSWNEAYTLVAKSMIDIARTYSGEKGAGLLRNQGYDVKMIEKMKGAGTQSMKFRGGIPLLGVIKLFGQYRMANSMALLDSYVRGVKPDQAVGGMGFDNYSWHTDLPPGHPMVTGQQTVDFDLVNAEYANIILCWGMNWICSKMPDGHWLSEARLKGAKVVTIATDYNCTSSKADEIIIIRPGTDPGFALGVAQVIIQEKLYDEEFVKGFTDLPLLVRMDTRKPLRTHEIISGHKNTELKFTKVIKKGENPPPPFTTNLGTPAVPEEMREEWGDFVVWDAKARKAAAVSRDDTGERFEKMGIDPAEPVKIKPYFKMQSAHFYAHGDTPLKVHDIYFTGKTHMPTPTKFFWFSGSNSILGNCKGMYDVVMNLLRNRKIEALVVNEWWWSASCEYADIVMPADSWGEYNVHDMTASVTNPFVMLMPLTGIKRIWDSKSDSETYAGVGEKLAELTGDGRFKDYWKFIGEGKAKTYLQRIINHCNTMKGYQVDDLLARAEDGVPALLMSRTYPKFVGYDQSVESVPWYNKTGRLEFYREEPEFLDYGENLPVHREPVDATFYEPNAIVANAHPLIKPKTPTDYGWPLDDLSGETRQVRNVVYSPDELLKTKHPLRKDGFTHIYLTPKFRHSVHTFCVDLDLLAIWFGPFGDMYRKDKRKPWVNEGYVEINPDDAKELGIEDGDYIWVDPDPEDRPFRGWKDKPSDYKVSRCLLRARYHPNIPKGVTRTWFNMYQSTHGSVRGHESRKDGLAKNPDTNYQSMYRYGGHQSSTRSWLRPTLLTDTLVRKNLMGQVIGKGFVPDVHCANGAPRESFVKFTRAEDGGESGKGKWRPAVLGFRATYENDAMQKYITGGFIS